MPCSEQSWVIPCSLLLQAGDWEGIASRQWVWGLPWERGVYVHPFRCDLSHAVPCVCCPGQSWCCTPLLAELLSLPALHPDFVCGCTNIWHIANSNRNGSDRARIAASTPQWQFWFQCTSDCHQREGEQSWELKYWPNHYHYEEMYWWSWLWEKLLLFQISRCEEILTLPSANL